MDIRCHIYFLEGEELPKMKRSAQLTKQLLKLEEKRAKTRAKLDHVNAKLITTEIEKSTRARSTFIHNMGISWVLRKPAPTFANDTDDFTLMGILQLPEIVELILAYMGPMELYITTRVSRAFLEYTTKAFISLVPRFVTSYGEDITANRVRPGTEKYAKEVDDELTNDYNERADFLNNEVERLKEGEVPVYRVLFGLYMMFVEFRQYEPEFGEKQAYKNIYPINFTFLYDNDTHLYTRLNELNLFRMIGFNEAALALSRRWKKKEYLFSVQDDDKLQCFNYKELTKMKFTPITQPFLLSKEVALIYGNEIVRLVDQPFQLFGISRYSEPYKVGCRYDSGDTPFFDHYEMRVLLDKRRRELELKSNAQIRRENVEDYEDRHLV